MKASCAEEYVDILRTIGLRPALQERRMAEFSWRALSESLVTRNASHMTLVAGWNLSHSPLQRGENEG